MDITSSATFTIYRGQGMSKSDFEQMIKIKGGLISFNNFLFTSTGRNVSVRFARDALADFDLMGILFVVVVDPSISSTPFVSVTAVSCFQTEDEVLFSMHTVFHIRGIEPMNEHNRLFQVDLILTSDNDTDLGTLTDRLREETKQYAGWFRLSELLRSMGLFAKAEQFYAVLAEQATEDREKAPKFINLGR